MEVAQLLLDKVVVAKRQIPMVWCSEDHRDSQLQLIDKVSPSCRGAEADLYSLTGVMRWFMAMVRRMFFAAL